MIWILVKEKEGQLPRDDLAAAALFRLLLTNLFEFFC